MRQNHTHCAPAANKNRLLSFCNKDFYRIISLPSHFSLPSFQKQRKTSLGFENITWCQGKISQFRFKHLFWRLSIMLTGSSIARKISHTVQLRAVGFALGFCSLRGRNGADGVCLCLGTKYRSQTTPSGNNWSAKNPLLSYCSVGNKKILNPNVTFLSWKPPKMLSILFLTYFLHFKLIFSLFSATLEHIDKHIQYKSQVAASQHVKLKNNFFF